MVKEISEIGHDKRKIPEHHSRELAPEDVPAQEAQPGPAMVNNPPSFIGLARERMRGESKMDGTGETIHNPFKTPGFPVAPREQDLKNTTNSTGQSDRTPPKLRDYAFPHMKRIPMFVIFFSSVNLPFIIGT